MPAATEPAVTPAAPNPAAPKAAPIAKGAATVTANPAATILVSEKNCDVLMVDLRIFAYVRKTMLWPTKSIK